MKTIQTWKRKEKRRRRSKVGNRIIKIGDTVDLSKHLFTTSRNYLLNYGYGGNQQIKAEDLDGKVIILLFVSPRDHMAWSYHLPHMVDMYLNLKDRLEIIFVAYADDMFLSYPESRHFAALFDRFCMLPWPAIPLSDVICRKHLRTMFGVSDTGACHSFIIDQKGVVLQSHATLFSFKYGAAAYPFTNERIQSLELEDEQVKKQPSITRLLASDDGQDFLINIKGEQVPLNSLEDKVVGLFFWAGHGRIYKELEKAYEELSRNNQPFEVVFIFAQQWSGNWVAEKEWFWHEYTGMPWLAIPFDHTTRIKKLQRIFKFCHEELDELDLPEARLVIIGRQGENFIQESGANILQEYGASAYPFNLYCAFGIEMEKVCKVDLQKLWDSKDVFTKGNGTEVPFSELLGKRIIVVFQKNDMCRFVSMLEDLEEIYEDVKGSNDEFEVIHVHSVSDETTPVPWLSRTPFDKGSYGYELMSDLFPYYYNGFLAFDLDGLLVRKACLPAFGDQEFPFHVCPMDMEMEIFAELVERLKIPLEELDEDERYTLERIRIDT